MKCARAVIAGVLFLSFFVASTGCATYRTISVAESGSPMIYSGTRLNLHAIRGNEAGIRKFQAPPPSYPLADLPLSFLLDTMIFPLTFSVSGYELVTDVKAPPKR